MLRLNHVCVAYQNKTVVTDVSFALKAGQIGCLLGPSGCGKTSLLRVIAGFEKSSAGEVAIRDEVVCDRATFVSPQKRKVAVVFQDYALFPHLTVAQNIAFGIHKQSKKAQKKRVAELLSLVGLTGFEQRYPHQLSGGQQQRVALVRAMADSPELLLLDEPFSSLDSELREGLARELRAILKYANATALMVTHDQAEAFAMADVIGVVNQGRLLQWASAYALYHRPADRFVANFIGDGVFMRARVNNNMQLVSHLGVFPIDASFGFNEGDEVEFLVRPDDIVHDDNAANHAQVMNRSFQGAHMLYELALQDSAQQRVLCLAPSHHDHKIGENIGIRLDLEHMIVFSV
ncbi:ABC transporter ATP-binding protein [Paraglaciecola aquimarina]|uniref:ABC transporter ATP-binding protein n=1 Tax=Paraglaciecola aquimarina TaxID=1235557 RepID=A0ABU3SXQ1_9ALTE|nr:ABC transporter ATP-binding protein [Paraglaciecola aquimarina]MDU0354791.1 ABC transporter ATP-binding protein [Paraglaciecola aquimarina]